MLVLIYVVKQKAPEDCESSGANYLSSAESLFVSTVLRVFPTGRIPQILKDLRSQLLKY